MDTCDHLLGVDVGTSSIKAVIVDRDGAIRGQGRSEYGYVSRHALWAEQTSEAWMNGLVAAVHDAVAGRKGAFARMIAGVSRAQKEGIRRIDVSIPVTRTNIDELPAAVGVALRMNPAAIHLAYPEPASRAARQGKVVPWAEAKDRVAGALDVSRRVSVQGIPLCLLPDRPGAITPSPPWLMQRLRREKAKLPVCRDCVGFILCGGPFREEHDRVYGMHGEVRVLVRRSASRQDSSA